ncbi:hypothetical protein F4776DRAFT_676234 [Hypoxylon sp. NC0597]|nr:hypothetical protein F4776DRAFT_676234 [Hypoxylon sp. NC0597]
MFRSREFRSGEVPIGDGHYWYFRYPGRTARSVRWAFYDPEPKPPIKESYLKNAAATLKKTVLRKGKANPQEEIDAAQDTKGRSFNDLPFDMRLAVFKMIQSTPSWIHIKFKNWKPVRIDASNQEIYVNREWYEIPELRQGLSRIDPNVGAGGTVRALTKHILRSLISDRTKHRDAEEDAGGDPPFRIKLKHRTITPRVRREIDWFFFDGFVDMRPVSWVWPMCYSLYQIRKCVFKLDHLYEMIGQRSWSDPPPYFIWPNQSRIEELIIIVGEFRKEVQPSQMKQVRAFWVDDLSEEIDRLKIDYGQDVSESDNYMMGCITEFWSSAVLAKRAQRYGWLDTPSGRQWLAYQIHDENNKISKWLASPEGYRWLHSHGSRFLASESGRWWLVSDFGHPWLESDLGTEWLDTKAGKEFLKSPQALVWANIGTYEPSEFTPLGTQVRKSWFKTPAGREWQFSHCPNGNPPKCPERPQRQSHPGPDERVPIYFTNISFRGWRYVICPRDGAAQGPDRGPRVLAHYTMREITR